ncbi:MAG: ATP-binding protein [Solirubrobacterales bacterium]
MVKWILNKSLKFQITLILGIVLFIPAMVVGWNTFVPFKVETAVEGMQAERLNSLLFYIDEEFDKTELVSIKEDPAKIKKLDGDVNIKFGALSKISRGTNIGMYVTEISKSYEFWIPYNKEKNYIHDINDIPLSEQKKGMEASISEVIKKKNDKVDYISYNNVRIIRCFHPIISNGTVVAVVWADSLLPPELNYNRKVMMYMAYFIPIALITALILMGLIISNLHKNIYKIRTGLEKIGEDISYRIEDTEGEIGQIATFINNMGDSLEKKEQLEERVQRSEKLASLGHLISGVAHEIRNPLGIISGTVQLMEKNFKDVKGLEEYIGIIKEQCNRENKVIQELLDYARPSKNMMDQMNMNSLIQSILSFTNKYIQDNHIKLVLELEENLPEILMDCDKIKQVYVNIVINACEAMENGGQLTIRTRNEGQWVKTYFTDTGKGMDEIQMDNIFNPYYTTKPKGTGLGLTISNSIVELHGGYIEVKSKKYEGSEFIVALPSNNKEGGAVG